MIQEKLLKLVNLVYAKKSISSYSYSTFKSNSCSSTSTFKYDFYSFNLSLNIITLKTKISRSISSGDTIFVLTPISPCPRNNHNFFLLTLYNKRPYNTSERLLKSHLLDQLLNIWSIWNKHFYLEHSLCLSLVKPWVVAKKHFHNNLLLNCRVWKFFLMWAAIV
jgi:hypothetical protein